METTAAAFRAAHAADDHWRTMVRACLDGLRPLPEGANLGFVYVTDALDGDLEPVLATLREGTGIGRWVGTVGYGVCVSAAEYFDRPAIAVLVGALPEDSFRVVPTLTEPGEALPDEVASWAAARKPSLGIVHGDPRNAYLPAILHSLCDDTEAFLVGGLTASRGEFHQVAGRMTEGGLSGVLLGESVAAVSGLTQGCAPIGPVHEVSAMRENLVASLDGRPAFDVLVSDLGGLDSRDWRRVLGNIHVALPIAGSDRSDYLVRNIMGVDPRHRALGVAERLREGDRLMFVRRDATSAMADLERMLDDVTGRAGERAPRAALYFSCVARGPNLFGAQSEELCMIAERLPDVPLVGFFANGEICNDRLYGYTGVLALLL